MNLIILTIANTPYCYMTLAPDSEVNKRSKSLLYKANKGELPNKKFNELFFQSDSKQVELLVISAPSANLQETKTWVRSYIEGNFSDEKQNNITNLDEIYHGKITTVVMIKHSEDPGFVIIITNNYDKINTGHDVVIKWYETLSQKLPRLAAMIKRSGINDTYHQVIMRGDRDTCVSKADEMLQKYSDDIRCLNYTF